MFAANWIKHIEVDLRTGEPTINKVVAHELLGTTRRAYMAMRSVIMSMKPRGDILLTEFVKIAEAIAALEGGGPSPIAEVYRAHPTRHIHENVLPAIYLFPLRGGRHVIFGAKCAREFTNHVRALEATSDKHVFLGNEGIITDVADPDAVMAQLATTIGPLCNYMNDPRAAALTELVRAEHGELAPDAECPVMVDGRIITYGAEIDVIDDYIDEAVDAVEGVKCCGECGQRLPQ